MNLELTPKTQLQNRVVRVLHTVGWKQKTDQ